MNSLSRASSSLFCTLYKSVLTPIDNGENGSDERALRNRQRRSSARKRRQKTWYPSGSTDSCWFHGFWRAFPWIKVHKNPNYPELFSHVLFKYTPTSKRTRDRGFMYNKLQKNRIFGGFRLPQIRERIFHCTEGRVRNEVNSSV